jgi:ABC-2 type transport system ATP-binding protein
VFEARALTRWYRGFLAVDKVSFEIRRGEILGYLGPNGSGKTTTINMVVGLLDPSAGSLHLDGVSMSEDPVGCKRRIGYIPEEPHLYTHLTATEYLTLVGHLRGLARARLDGRIARLLQLFALFESRYSALSAYSKGMRQRVLLAAALLHNPDLLVLDEPFSGLDVSAGLLFRTLLHLFAREGRMILFSSHRLDVVEKVCSSVIIIHRGRIVARTGGADVQDATGSLPLEDLFARATEQEDYTSVAKDILGVMQDV